MGRRTSIGLVGATGLLAVGLWPLTPSAAQQAKAKPQKGVPTFARDVRPVIKQFCIRCHSGPSASGGIALDKVATEAAARANSQIWDKVAVNVGSGHMPPAGAPAPSKAQRQALVNWSQALLASCELANPGRVTMRRLNRMEYDNTIRDLTGLDLHLSSDFPSDDVGYGFDNVGDVLSISPLLMEKYLRAAGEVAKQAIVLPSKPAGHYDADALRNTTGGSVEQGGWILFSAGAMVATHNFPHTGMYRVKIGAYGQQAGPEAPKMAVRVDKQLIDTVEVKAVEAKPGVYEFPVRVEAGKHEISAEYTNDYYTAGPPPQDRNLAIDYIEVVQPEAGYDGLPDSHKRIIPPDTAAGRPPIREVLKAFANRAFRRPATSTEVDRLTQIANLVMKDGESYERAVQVGVQAVLSSPNFLFRVEREDSKAAVGPYELASRLSYFLWGSMPDDRLQRLAASGELAKVAILEREARRMLADPKSEALADGFAAQWLNLRKLSDIAPDPKEFPEFSDKLRDDMMTETKTFFDGIVRNDRSVLDFLGARYSYMNERLAKHYGIEGVQGDQFRRVSLQGTPRGGLLSQASILTLTSNPTRTSPVKRGKWVLDELLNQPPPPPPPGVGDLSATGKMLTGTLRQKMEQHRKDPSCASCHRRMDPIGFSLENFDPTGKWRTKEGEATIDASGVLTDGTKFSGPTELRNILLGRKNEFVACLADKMLTYAIGRGMESTDRCYIDRISTTVRQNGYRFSSLVAAIVTSEPFRMRRPAAKGSK
ncbi:DUF1592 domain-containing protein [Fimbriimonas ginsengisoli]|uniref:Cytochrome c domain-containing protein n=1 Tax=Fimbriimonas ginsengisoli Gsoil 348 TaxID=661478 RepID=A0A068NU94_FIMGI|nr:DUF1592 domain-containing protein [Fimbriimonas ginsengisoli]AIE86937.1 hypothetical protein OP10G_3569 [Fimbriimonas ginsengisoli Gsoil 348]